MSNLSSKMNDEAFKAAMDALTYEDILNHRKQKALYNQLVELLNLNQFSKIMGGCMKFTSKAAAAKRVSKSKRVHALADAILAIKVGA